MSSAAPDKNAVTINVLGREFRVGCPENEQKQLLASVEYLNRRIKEVRDTGRAVGNERIAIMAALNIAHESMSKNGAGSGGSLEAAAIRRRITAMQETLEAALAADQEKLF